MTATTTYLGTVTPQPTDDQVKEIFVALNAQFNSIILAALLHGKRN